MKTKGCESWRAEARRADVIKYGRECRQGSLSELVCIGNRVFVRECERRQERRYFILCSGKSRAMYEKKCVCFKRA